MTFKSLFFRTLFLPLFLPFVCIGQTRDIRTKSTYFDNSGELKCKFEYFYDFWSEKDVEHGRFSEWNKKGKLVVDCDYKEGKLDGLFHEWYKNGMPKETSDWMNGERNGLTQIYDKKGTLISETTFRNGLKNGLETIYYPNGRVEKLTTWIDGSREGQESYFTKNGKLATRENWHAGARLKVTPMKPNKETKPEKETNTEKERKPLFKPKEKKKEEPKPEDPAMKKIKKVLPGSSSYNLTKNNSYES